MVLLTVGLVVFSAEAVECPPPIECLWCPNRCPEGQVLVEDPCTCCRNHCEPA